jgi:fructose-specific phosphotransferase system IIC component
MTEGADPPQYVEEELDLSSFERDRPWITEGRARPVEATRATLAYLMLALLAAVIVSLVVLIYQRKVTPEELSALAGVLIAPIVGLLGAATGYYYGRGEK